MVFSSSGQILYASESVTSLLGYFPSELVNTSIYDITHQEDQSQLYNILLNPGNSKERQNKKGIIKTKVEPLHFQKTLFSTWNIV